MIRGKDLHSLRLATAAGTDVSKQAFLEPLIAMDRRHLAQNFSSVFFLFLHRDFFSTDLSAHLLYTVLASPGFTIRVASLGETFRFRPRPGQ